MEVANQSLNVARLCHILVPRVRLTHGQQSMPSVAGYENGLRAFAATADQHLASEREQNATEVCQCHVYARTLGILVLTSACVIYLIQNIEVHSESAFLQLFQLVSNSGLR